MLPYTLEGTSTLKGFIDEKNNKIDIEANIPLLKSNKQQIENISLVIENPKQQLLITTRAQLETKDEMLRIYMRATAAKDTIGTQLGWQNNQQITNAGEIAAVARFKTENGNITLELTPTEKVIKKIRLQRPDIFLVGFKTTTNETIEGQFLSALKMMKSTKCNLVLANDTVNRRNIIITPEESYYGETTNRENVLNELVEILTSRQNATYNRTNFILGDNYPITKLSNTFQTVVKFLIDNGGFLENNGNGFTPGHFCQKISDNSFVSSQRKANHNLVFENGMSLVEVSEDDKFTVTGTLKASVGARSQWLLLNDNKDYDCIIHTHNPAKLGHVLPITPQKPFQCGSLECGLNTLNHLRTYQNGSYDYLKAVYLEKHGANILFKSTTDPNTIIDFIKNNLDLGIKVK